MSQICSGLKLAVFFFNFSAFLIVCKKNHMAIFAMFSNSRQNLQRSDIRGIFAQKIGITIGHFKKN